MLQSKIEVTQPTESRTNRALGAYGWGLNEMCIAVKQGWLASPLPRQRWKTDGSKWGERLHLALHTVLVLGVLVAVIYAPHYTPNSEGELVLAVLVLIGSLLILAMRLPNILDAIFGR